MDKRIVIGIALIVVVVIALAFAYIFFARSASSVVYVDPKTIQRTVGQDFALNISISNVADLYGWELKLSWNSTILEAVSVTEGPFLKNGGDTFFSPRINNTVGYIMVDCTLLEDVSGVNGNGVLATIQFHVKESGSCLFDLYDTLLLNSAVQELKHTVNDGQFST